MTRHSPNPCGHRCELQERGRCNSGQWQIFGHLQVQLTCAFWPTGASSVGSTSIVKNFLLIACLALWVWGFWWAVMAIWSLGGHGQVISLNQDLAQDKYFSFQEVYISLLQLTWSCSRILGVYVVVCLLGFVLSCVWCIFPPQIFRVYQGAWPSSRLTWTTAWTSCDAFSFFSLSLSDGTFHVCAQWSVTLCDPIDCSSPVSSVHGVFSGKNTGVSCHFLLQGTFLTQGSNLHLLLWQLDSLPLAPPGKPYTFHITW